MARTQIRSTVGVVTTTLGLAVLLAGPNSTLGLGVPAVDSATTQVTSTVQGAVDTTTQTAATTVTQVESTVQTTVQATTQPVATQPAAPAPVAAPTQTVLRATAPVKKQATHVSRPAQRPATTTGSATKRVAAATGSVRTTVATRAPAAHARKVPRVDRAVTTRSRATESGDPAPQCVVPLLAALPGGAQLQALLALACDAADSLGLTTRIGLAPHADSAASGLGALGASRSGLSSPARARSASLGDHRTAGDSGRADVTAASLGTPGAPIGRPAVPATGRAGAIGFVDAVNAAHVAPASGAAPRAASAAPHHHTFFSGQSRGTEVLLAIIFASLAILAGIVLWRLAARWVIPRFA